MDNNRQGEQQMESQRNLRSPCKLQGKMVEDELYKIAQNATRYNQLEVLRLLENNPNVDLSFKNNLLLHIACQRRYIRLAKFLLKNKKIQSTLKDHPKQAQKLIRTVLETFPKCPTKLIHDLQLLSLSPSSSLSSSSSSSFCSSENENENVNVNVNVIMRVLYFVCIRPLYILYVCLFRSLQLFMLFLLSFILTLYVLDILDRVSWDNSNIAFKYTFGGFN